MTIREHKSEAAESIGRHLGIVALIMIVHNIVIDFAFPLIAPAFVIGLSSVALTLQQGIKPEFSQLWKGFEYYGKSFWLYYSCRLLSLLWGLLFIVPGIIKWYSLSMAPFIMAEKPGLSVKEARQLSRELTNEYKLRIFLLDLSFIGWYVVAVGALALLKAGMILLAFVLATILSLWLTPYMMTARADLYQYIKEQKNMAELKPLDTQY